MRLSISFSAYVLSAVLSACVTAGVLAREPWTTSRVMGSPEPPKPYATQRIYPQLQFDQPVELLPLSDTGKMLLLEVGGKVYTFDDDPDCSQADLAFDLTPRIDNFRRAFGIGVHPNFMHNREIFVCYVGDPIARPDGSRLSRFRMTKTNPPRIDPDSEEILLTWASGGHNGCAIRFDSDGYLYFSAGDGARPFPPDEYDVSQDLSDLRATICRIDVDRREAGKGYAIPKDNPFINLAGARPEIWAYGFRNPWRFTIDPKTDDILCGDVGWELWELVHHVQRGGNHGWSIFEGPQPIRGDIKPGPTPIIKPLVSYPHTQGLSVTGGIVYHGHALPELEGSFLYGDYVTGLVWGLRFEGEQVTWNELLAETGLKIITFAEGRDGEALIVSFDGGIYRLVKNKQADQPSAFPRKLSQTGLFASTHSLEPAAGVFPYEITTHAWQDGATSQFVLGVPGNETIATNQQQRNWKYPVGTVFAKTLSRAVVDGESRAERRIETQLLHFDGISWQPYSYAWNDDQTDALLVDSGGATAEFEFFDPRDGETEHGKWRFHSRAECRACHSNQAGGAVAFTFANLATKPSSIDATRDQVADFVDWNILDSAPAAHRHASTMVDPADDTATLEQRARSYLAANCAHCHCRGGGGTVALDLSLSHESDAIFAIDFPATQGSFGIENAKVIEPGDPHRSVLYYRMATSGTGHMPKLWSRDNDRLGLSIVHDWIASIKHAAPIADNAPSIHLNGPLDDVPSALRLFHRLLNSEMPEQARNLARTAFSESDALTRGLFERFLPPEERIQRLGADIEAEKILSMVGHADRGADRYRNSKTQQCRNCHRVAGQGQSVGPDLDGLAQKRSRAELLHSILDPSAKIEPEFVSYAVVTVDGEVISGLRIEQTSQYVVLRSADGKNHRIAREEIEQMTAQSNSLMPVGLAAEMTAEELADLLEFLCSLK